MQLACKVVTTNGKGQLMRSVTVLLLLLLASPIGAEGPGAVVVYTADHLNPLSKLYCPSCVFRVNEAQRQGTQDVVVIYRAEQLDPLSKLYCPSCVFRVNEANRQGAQDTVVVYTVEQLNPLSGKYCPVCVQRIMKAEHPARE